MSPPQACLPREGDELGQARAGRVGGGAERSGARAQGRELRGRVDLGGGGGHESGKVDGVPR